jgi:hypothetical protein
MKRLKRETVTDSLSEDLPLIHYAREPRDAMEGYMQASALHQLLVQHLTLPVTVAGNRSGLPVGQATLGSGPCKELGGGWFEMAVILPALAPEFLDAGERGRALASQLPIRIALFARLGQDAMQGRPAAVWRLSDTPHPLIRPTLTRGVVASEDRYEQVTLVVTPPPGPAAGAAEGGMSGASAPGAGRRVRANQDRYATISYLAVESRSRCKEKPDGWWVPKLCIRAKWLALYGFDIAQRVHIAAEPGRLVITPVAAAETAGEG